jgi:biopolymer transport protein ExbD
MRKKKEAGESPKLDMTPMIDVVFQLLIFFVVTLKQDDILSKLTGARPMAVPGESAITLIDIGIDARGFALNGRALDAEALDRQIGRLAAFSQRASVVIRCAPDSPHALLVQALDVCNQHGMAKVSILSR